MKEDVKKWARECASCQRSKVLRNVNPPIGEFEVPNKRFDHVHLDIVHLPSSNGFSYLLTAVDRFTRWPVAIPLRNITAEIVADSFAHGWVAAYGVPSTVTTDRGSQFGSEIFTQLLATWGIKSNTTMAYHPESNGLVEQFHRRLKEAMAEDEPSRWFWRMHSPQYPHHTQA